MSVSNTKEELFEFFNEKVKDEQMNAAFGLNINSVINF